ncbi:MAG: ferric reductase-like transmembrane domain-containing protein [Candidatus Micrarchaeia archaeon]
MQKPSFLFLLLAIGIALLGAYQGAADTSSHTAIIRFLALSAFFLLSVSLMIGPLAVLQPSTFAQLIEFRRAVGLAAAAFAALHALLVLALYFGWDFALALSPMPHLIALPALFILAALALTSCDYAVQKLGMGKWKTLHYFVYPAFVLILAHFILKSNGLMAKQGVAAGSNISEASLILLAGATLALQFGGFFVRRKRKAAASS